MEIPKVFKAVLFPPKAVLIVSLPTGIAALVYAFMFLNESDPIRITAYVISFYVLTIWCVRIPRIIRFFTNVKNNNKYLQRWLKDTRFRTNITLSLTTIWNTAYAVFQLCLGIYHGSAWFYALSSYYFFLAIMRFFLVRYSIENMPGENMRRELRRYRSCGVVFLPMNTAISFMIFYMICENRDVSHHEITVIATAAYTFTALSAAIVNIVKYRKYKSPVLSASKSISLAAACVSMITLERTMLETFGSESMAPQTKTLFLALSGGAVSIFTVTAAIYMIIKANRNIKRLENGNER